jgi:hypothetical protein
VTKTNRRVMGSEKILLAYWLDSMKVAFHIPIPVSVG